jgi:hypothetical protein
MPDISMCRGELAGETCPLRDACWRYIARPNPDRQAYLIPEAVGEDCDAYWGVRGRDKTLPLGARRVVSRPVRPVAD